MANGKSVHFYIFLFLTIITIATFVECKTMHVDKCDNFCGGSKLNPFGKSGTCKSCCLEKGFYSGGECGDLLYRHCRCILNPPGVLNNPPFNPNQLQG